MLNPVKILFYTFKDKSSCFRDRKDHRKHQPLHLTEDTANGVEELRHLAMVTSDSRTEMRSEGKFFFFFGFYQSSTYTLLHKLNKFLEVEGVGQRSTPYFYIIYQQYSYFQF